MRPVVPVPRLHCRRLLCFTSSLIPREGCLRNPRSFTLHVHRHVPRPYKYAAASTPSLPIYSFSCSVFLYSSFLVSTTFISLTGVAFVFEATNLDDSILAFSPLYEPRLESQYFVPRRLQRGDRHSITLGAVSQVIFLQRRGEESRLIDSPRHSAQLPTQFGSLSTDSCRKFCIITLRLAYLGSSRRSFRRDNSSRCSAVYAPQHATSFTTSRREPCRQNSFEEHVLDLYIYSSWTAR